MKKQKSKGSHSFEGCKTCRKRHLKCDQTLPKCTRCRLAGLSCDFKPALRWLVSNGPDVCNALVPNTDEENSQYSRRHLFTEDSRRSMSSALIDHMPSSVSAALSQIEEQSRHVAAHRRAAVAIGPFGIFEGISSWDEIPSTATEELKILSPVETSYGYVSVDSALCSSSMSTSPSLVVARQETTTHQNTACNIESSEHTDTLDNSFGISNAMDEVFSTSLDFLQWGDLFTWDTDFLGQASAYPPATNPESIDATLEWSTELDIHDAILCPEETASTIRGAELKADVKWPEVDMTVDAPALLKHFNQEVINQMGSLPINEKSGWRILNVTSAILTLSQLTMFGINKEDIAHASMANLYGLLAVSAFHLSLNSAKSPNLHRPEHYWKSLSSRTYEAARFHLKTSLRIESNSCSPKKAKYKEQLMAVGAVLATALLSGNEVDSHIYLVEMERLIRFRGLTKPKLSRRARLFHNIYAWMRIVSESTKVLHEEDQLNFRPPSLVRTGLNTPEEESVATPRAKPAPSTAEAAVLDINPDITLDSFLHLEPFQIQSDTSSGRGGHDANRDIHLVSTLNCHEDMHMRIYGVPETWLRLVSQVTRLANVMDRLTPTNGMPNAEALASLQPKALSLEEAVCDFKTRYQSAAQTESNQGRPHIHMARALSAALVIFFYRRIRKIHPMMLQDSVSQVLESLLAFDEALEKHGLLGPGTAWPAFIAGAEATGFEQRYKFERWLSRAGEKSGWKSYSVSKEVLNEVWRQRDSAGGAIGCPTWVDVCKQMHRWPLLC